MRRLRATDRPWALVGLALAFAAATGACSDDSAARDAGPDASFISGDAGPGDEDGGAEPDAGPHDGGAELDAGPPDAADAGDLDAGQTDVDPCLAEPIETLPATAAADRAGALAGQVIALTGTATRTALDCTERACSEEDPCCNDCTARIRVGEVLLAESVCFAAAPACEGTECSQTCRPPLFGLPQTFRGVLSTSTPDLELLLYSVD